MQLKTITYFMSTFNGHAEYMKCYVNVTIWYSIYSPDFKHFETLLKHYYITGADF